MKFNRSILLAFDEKWCGSYQVPASLIFKVAGGREYRLASLRLCLAGSLIGELVGYFLITLGLLSYWPVWVFLCGICLKISGELASAFFQNKSGTLLSIELYKYLKRLSMHSVEIHSLLADRGCSEAEINSLQSLGTDVYQSELNGYQRARIVNIGAPLACGLALLINRDIATALVVFILGLISFPLGERFFKENIFRRESELRLGLAAQLLPYIEKIYKEHVWLTTRVNFLSQLPLLLFTFRFLWNSSGQLLSSFFGLTQGLAGLTGTLAFQKARATSIRTTTTTEHLINALSSPYLIVTPQRWEEHCLKEPAVQSASLKIKNGIVLTDFCPHYPFGEQKVASVSCVIPSGSIRLLRAPSGKGKTTFLAALTHLIEHKGELFFATEGRFLNAHALSREVFDKKIFFFREENIDKSARLVDLFKGINFAACGALLKSAKARFDAMLIDLAWQSPDNLVELEIKNIEQRRASVFSVHMLDFLKELRKLQIERVSVCLKNAGGNLGGDRIFYQRNFATLSSGEKRRLVALIALESCRASDDIDFVILDEPLTHLDTTNMAYQMQTLREMQELVRPPAMLVISHHFVEEMRKKLGGVEEIGFGG